MITDDRVLAIDTPENVIFGYELAGLGARFLATAVDTILIAFLQVMLLLALGLIGNAAGWLDEDATFLWLGAIYLVGAFLILWGYYIIFELLWNGQSPGKRLVKLRVLRTDGLPVTLTESLIRNLVRLVDFLPVFYGVGVISMFISKQSRRLGDYAAKTLVVYANRPINLRDLQIWQPPFGEAMLEPATRQPVPLPVDRLSNDDLVLAETLLHRATSLTTTERLADQTLAYLFQRMQIAPHPLPPGESATTYLKRIVLTYRTWDATLDQESVSAESDASSPAPSSGAGVDTSKP